MIKRISAILLSLLIIAVSLTLTGCDKAKIIVESTMSVSSDFSGARTVKVLYPLSIDIDAVKDTIIEKSPAQDVKGADFTYLGVEENGYAFELKLTFSGKEEYKKTVSALIGRDADVYLSRINTPLCKGTRMKEDFDVSDMISWMARITSSDQRTKDAEFDYSRNTVNIDNLSFNTGSSIDISDREGGAVNSITIETANTKNDLYDRIITFSIPNDTYDSARNAIEGYFKEKTSPVCSYSGWTAKGEAMEYTVIFNKIGLEPLKEYTALLLNASDISVFYGDKDNSSTPLSEGLTFEESFDTFSYMSPEGGAVELYYSYSLPTETTHGDGSIKQNGNWKTTGEWASGVYSAQIDADTVSVRIPDGIQYSINGINFSLLSKGDDRFLRTTEFLYSKTDGYDGMSYAKEFFSDKGADVEVYESDTDLICKVSCEGTTGEITDMLVKYFGSGNFMSYEKRQGAFSLSVKTELVDYVNIGYMLNSSNANRPMSYSVRSACEENIVELSADSEKTTYRDSGSDDPLSLPIDGGSATVTYKGNIPIIMNIIIYISVGAMLLAATVLICFLLARHNKKKDAPSKLLEKDFADPDTVDPISDKDDTPLSQTTTFSLSELGILSKNKKYVDEINKDIEERLEADRLETLKKELKAKEIAEMEQKVYGSEDDTSEEAEPSKEQESGDD